VPCAAITYGQGKRPSYLNRIAPDRYGRPPFPSIAAASEGGFQRRRIASLPAVKQGGHIQSITLDHRSHFRCVLTDVQCFADARTRTRPITMGVSVDIDQGSWVVAPASSRCAWVVEAEGRFIARLSSSREFLSQ
jgi:hypothetical protein